MPLENADPWDLRLPPFSRHLARIGDGLTADD